MHLRHYWITIDVSKLRKLGLTMPASLVQRADQVIDQ
jgi:hypothetical protein